MMNKTDMMQDIEKILLTQEQLHTRILELGKELSDDYRGKDLVVVGVLKGVVPFYTALTQSMDIPMRQDFMCISSYAGTETTGKLTFHKDLNYDIEGQHVLILEDIVDSGITLSKLAEMLKERRPASLKVCTLMDKPSGRKVAFEADYTGFVIPDGFVVGYGLDYNDYYRNLPFVGILKKEVYAE